ncbi:DUF885 domain-containing protein [Hyphococcus flavus]|uniref:DUF885 domain-containing protein n=1 Tax=Hyphococcus flavus TaxID=1866326 RepID=A0AAE9ZBF0_9PROT|nr:DUF885 domain-containing protein [Hyphococcus flavus]WDI30961.1 DUF885 domain-containing protein [Hyphococcus flavus]
MRIIGKIFGFLLLLLVLAAGAASMWFWFTPVGVNNYVNKVTFQFLTDSPELMTQLGFIDNTPLDFHSGKLADYTQAQDEKSLEKLRKARAGLDKYGPDGLEGQELLTWKITAWFFDDLLRQAEFEYGGYRVSQLSGPLVNMPSFLTDAHVIKNEKSVKRYISRLNEFGRVLRETKVRVEDDRDNGVVPPDFVIEKSLTGMRSFIEGGAAENPLVTTLPAKLEEIGLSEDKQAGYMAQATEAVETEVIPGYEAMIALFEALLENTDHNAGIWRIPDGAEIYKVQLKSNTTTDFTADEIHETGLSEVALIEQQMDDILVSQGYTEGTVAERVRVLMEAPDQIYPNTDEGRQEMLDYLSNLNDEVMEIAGDYFITLPPQPLEVVRVPEFSEDGAPGGYYNAPALDGSRPGRFYINQKDTADNPKWTLPTLLIHEGAPGHHFQISLSQMIEGVPMLRKLSPFTAYSEGWALYAERVAKIDMGMYDDDPLGDLGRLQAEMYRAVRLVVDTGIHHKRWSREQAIEYMASKTGMTDAEVTREIERYAVWPGQATAYKTGQLAILRMRERAENELGDDFDLREFHETVLMNGGMPLGILDEVVDEWIEAEKAS